MRVSLEADASPVRRVACMVIVAIGVLAGCSGIHRSAVPATTSTTPPSTTTTTPHAGPPARPRFCLVNVCTGT